jgi:asparagine synthase (glutamine-hydrolysing)
VCGIAGVVAHHDASRWVMRMLQAEKHRGPDGHGLWSWREADVHAVLGHRRLAIIDLSDVAAQPMQDSGGTYTIVFNGEIYNFVEIREQLSRDGVVFQTHSDTEIILEAYKKWGTECLARFNGMFSFALHDQQRKVLFCARDRYGEKPFLYASGKDFFVFASEYKAILLDPRVAMDIDESRLISAAYNPSTGLDGDRDTVFRGVKQLLPAEAMEIDLRTLAQRRWIYWQMAPRQHRERVDESEIFAEFRDLLIDSVRLRLRSDVTVGSCLSGGLDSSSIVGIVRQLLGHGAPYHTFTGRFPGTTADEWQYAEEVVRTCRVTSHIVEPSVDAFLDELPTFMWYNELPVASSSQFAQWCVFRLARDHNVTVLLDGQGADETLGGYEQYFVQYVRSLRQRGDISRLERELPRIRQRYPAALSSSTRALRDRLPLRLRHSIATVFGTGTSLLYGLCPEFARRVSEFSQHRQLEGLDALSSALVQDTFGRYLTTLLRYGDRNSMAHSREVRLPFCDHRIAEFVFGLPPELLMGEVQTKRLLRESMRGILPERIRTRWNKQGFRPPQESWFKSPRMVALAKTTFESSEFRQSSLWAAGWWNAAIRRVEAGQLHLGWVIWQPVMISQWYEHFVKQLVSLRATPAVTV